MIETLNRQINQLRDDLKSKDLESETMLRRKQEEERQRELHDKNDNLKLQQEIEYAKKQKLELESSLRIELQKWRSEAEFSERKLKNTEDELKGAKAKISDLKQELDQQRKSQSNRQAYEDDMYSKEKFGSVERDRDQLIRLKDQLEDELKVQTNEMQKFQFEYEDQVQHWKKEKGDLQMRLQELHMQNEKLRYDSHEQIENFKGKYNEYKNKLKKANQNIATLTTRVAKYELAMAADKEIGRVGGFRGVGHRQALRSSDGAFSPGIIGGDFNMADYNNEFENQELNEEIKKLLLESQL